MSQKLKPKIRINSSYYDFIPRPNQQDRENLKKSIKKDGVQIPIIVNPQGFILDGHTRYEICKELEIDDYYIPIEVQEFNSEDEERQFVVMTNLARRQLNQFQRVELSWGLYELEKKRAKERELWKQNINSQFLELDEKGRIKKLKKKIKEGNAVEVFGKQIGISKTQVGYVDFVKKYGSKEIIEKCRNGSLSVGIAYDLIRGLRLMSTGNTPLKEIKFCPLCKNKTVSPKVTKCHVHKWFCCDLCRWGL